jgi:hypothetical protein
VNQDKIIQKLNVIFVNSLELKGMVAGNPALEGDIDRILAISREKLLLLDPENFVTYQRGSKR